MKVDGRELAFAVLIIAGLGPCVWTISRWVGKKLVDLFDGIIS